MGDLTENLSRSEFECKCGCGFDTVDIHLADILQDVVDHFEIAMAEAMYIKITGPNRCVSHNEVVQKRYNKDYVPFSSKSQHLYARAADFKIFFRRNNKQLQASVVSDYLELKYPNKYGIGRYSNRTHADSRSGNKARWDTT